MPTSIENFALRHVSIGSTGVLVESMSGGISSPNFRIDTPLPGSETGSKSYVLTLFPNPSDWWKIDKEIYLREMVGGDSDVLIPKLVDTGEDMLDGQRTGFLLRQFVEGNDLDQILEDKCSPKLKKYDWTSLTEDFGFRLASLHSHQLGYFGMIAGSQLPTLRLGWRGFIENEFAGEINDISGCNLSKKLGLVTPQRILELMPSLAKALQDKFPSLDTVSFPALVHGDMRFANVVAGRNGASLLSIKSLIDWEWALSGDPEIDLAYAENWLYFSTYRERFIEHKDDFVAGYNRKLIVSDAYLEKRLIYHALRSLNYLKNVFLYQPDNFTSLDPRFTGYVEGHFKVIESIANGKELVDLGILPIV